MNKITVWILLLVICCANLSAQRVLVLASANDNPNQLINGIFDGTTLKFRPSVASGGTSNGASNFLEFGQVRAHQSTVSGCTLLAQTHGLSGNVSLYTVSPQGDISLVPNTPFATDPEAGSVAFAPDGGALYLPVALSNRVIVLAISCTAGVVSISNLGTVSLLGVANLTDARVIGSGVGSHLCVSATSSGNAGCFAVDPISRLPTTAAVNLVTASGVRGINIANNGCGTLPLGNARLVQGFRVSPKGIVTLTNTAQSTNRADYGAIMANGSMAAMGGLGGASRDFSVYSVSPNCELSLIGSNIGTIGTPFVAYMTFDAQGRLYVADSLENRIRIFSPTSSSIGPAIVSSLTNHPRRNAPVGIDVIELTNPDGLFSNGFE
jgi:hypothetical protein